MLPDDGELLRVGLEALSQKLATLPVLSSRNVDQFDKTKCDALDGYKKLSAEETVYLIKRHVFDSLFISRQQQDLVENFLLDSGELMRAQTKGAKSSGGVPKVQHIWPDGQRRRSVELNWTAQKARS